MNEELKKIKFLKQYDSLFFVSKAIDYFFERINFIENKIKDNDEKYENDDIDLIDSLYNDDHFNSEVDNITAIFSEISNNLDFYNNLNNKLKLLNIDDKITVNLSYNFYSKIIYSYQKIQHNYLVFNHTNGYFILNIEASIEKMNLNKQLLNF